MQRSDTYFILFDGFEIGSFLYFVFFSKSAYPIIFFAAGILPRMLELLDATALDAVRSPSSFHIAEGVGAALLVETDGRDGTAMQDLVRLCEVALEHGATDSAIAQSEKDREGMRRARRLVSSCLKERFPRKMSDDIAVPRSRIIP